MTSMNCSYESHFLLCTGWLLIHLQEKQEEETAKPELFRLAAFYNMQSKTQEFSVSHMAPVGN